jgi:hypothetical protein
MDFLCQSAQLLHTLHLRLLQARPPLYEVRRRISEQRGGPRGRPQPDVTVARLRSPSSPWTKERRGGSAARSIVSDFHPYL